MAVSFAKPFYGIIADTSTRSEFQTARIRIEDPSLFTESDYDIETGEWELSGNPVIYPVGTEDGRARIIGVRWGVQTGGESQANSTTISSIRVQLPRGGVDRVKRGCKVFVESAPNPVLQGYVFTVTSDMQGASDAARTLECALDLDSIRGVEAGTSTITGTPEESETLTIVTSGWEPTDTQFAYQWYRIIPGDEPETVEIVGATAAQFKVPSGWVGSSLFASVRGTSPWFAPTTVQTEAVVIVE